MTTPLDKGCTAMEISSAVTDLVNDVASMSEHKLASAIQHLINTTAEQTAANLYRGSSAESDASGLIEAAEGHEAIAERIVRNVAELPDRTSPDDAPDMMLVTDAELTQIILDVLRRGSDRSA